MKNQIEAITNRLLPFITVLYLYSSKNRTILNNATGTLLDTGKRKLLITSFHVWEEFLEKDGNGEGSDLQLCFFRGPGEKIFTFDSPSPLDSNKDVDIVVFPFDNALPENNHKKYFKAATWPPARVRQGDAIFLVGYPGALRSGFISCCK